jgi:hypothetical protein
LKIKLEQARRYGSHEYPDARLIDELIEPVIEGIAMDEKLLGRQASVEAAAANRFRP